MSAQSPVLPLLLLLLLLVLLLLSCSSYEFDRFGKKKPKPKKGPQLPKKPVTLNTDLLPNITQILEELALTEYFPQLIKMGVTETHFLLRLTAMDYRIMLMDWEGVTEEQVNRIKDKAAVLYQQALVKDDPALEANFDDRNKLKYGRLYMPGAVQNFEYVGASFGGPPPVGLLELALAPGPGHFACNESEFPSDLVPLFNNKLLVVKRGECPFLTKALIAKVHLNATALVVANNEDRLDSPASGLGIDPNVTEKMVDPVFKFPIISVSNITWSKLAFSVEHAGGSPVTAQIVPLKCGTGGMCKPVLDEEKELLPEVTWGTARFRSEKSKEVRSFEFLTSNYGGRLPEDHEPIRVLLASPSDGCSEAVSFPGRDSLGAGLPFVAAFVRGNCRFSNKQQHAEAAGARLALIFEKSEGEGEGSDNALQRVGGLMPEAGYIGIPSILVSAPAGAFLQSKLQRGVGQEQDEPVTLSLVAGSDISASDRWIEVAFTEWAEGDEERLLQIQGLIQKHVQAGNVEIAAWLKRRADGIERKKTGKRPTDQEL